MMREMSYRDKMILLIISAIIILAVGFFALVKPKYTALKADKVLYEDTKAEWDGLEQKINAIPDLKDAVTKDYKDAKVVADIFVNEAFQPVNDTFENAKANYVLDQYIQPILDATELKVNNVDFSGITSGVIAYYYNTPDVLTYSLLENADINGEYAEQVTELLAASTYFSEQTTADVMTNSISLSTQGTKEQLMAFLKAIEEEENAVNITSVEIEDYSFGEGQTQTVEEQQTNPDGTVSTVSREVPVASDGNGESAMELELTFYNAMPIDEPVLGD